MPGDTSKGTEIMMAAQGDLTVNPGGGSIDVGGHLSWNTPIHLGLDGAIATSVLGGTYDFADGDISIDAIPLFGGITLAPRVGLSTVIVNEHTAFNGVNAGRRVPPAHGARRLLQSGRCLSPSRGLRARHDCCRDRVQVG